MSVIEESGEGVSRDTSTRQTADSDAEPKEGRELQSDQEAGDAGPAQVLPAAASEQASVDDASHKPDRRKLEEQLEALKRKELELRRALVIADHPALAEGIRVLEGRVFALTRSEERLAQGLSKSEARRKDVIEKKLASLHEKRAELDAQIATLDEELGALGAERQQAFEAERRDAIEQLLVALGTHEPALRQAGLDPIALVPELSRFLPDVKSLAESLVSARETSREARSDDLTA